MFVTTNAQVAKPTITLEREERAQVLDLLGGVTLDLKRVRRGEPTTGRFIDGSRRERGALNVDEPSKSAPQERELLLASFREHVRRTLDETAVEPPQLEHLAFDGGKLLLDEPEEDPS